MSDGAHGLSTDQVVDLLREIDLFRGLPEEDLRKLGDVVEARLADARMSHGPAARPRADAYELSRVLQAGLLPHAAPHVEGYDVAAGTIREATGRGGSVWDCLTLADGRAVVLTLDARQDGLVPAHHLATARAVLRSLARDHATVPELLARANDGLASAAIEGLDQYVDAGVLAVAPDGVEWASAGRVPGGIVRFAGPLVGFSAHGPPLGMLDGFVYTSERFTLGQGDVAFVLSHGSQGLFQGAADLVSQLHGRPAGEIVTTLHKAIRRAHGERSAETSVLFARRH